MRAPVKRLLKREVEWLGSHSCKHHHSYLEHYQCFLEEKPQGCPFVERVGFLDIETSNLDADFGIIFSYAIKPLDRDEILGRVVTKAEMRRHIFDRKIVAECINDMKKFHRLVVHWGKDRRHDIPWIRTRALLYGHEFPDYKSLYVEDTFDLAKAKLKLHRNRLETIASFFGIPCKGHPMNPKMWQKAQTGDKPSLEWIWLHNLEDVETLEKVWLLLKDFGPRRKTSI